METAREKAIRILDDYLTTNPEFNRRDMVVEFVDAVIEAARAPESAHTRAVKETNDAVKKG